MISKSNNNSSHDSTCAFFSMFFLKKTRTLMPLSSKNINKLSLVESLIILDRTIVYSPELYWNSSQTISWGCFEIAAPKYLENCQKKRMWWVPFRVARIKSTAYYRNALQIHSGSAQKGKSILKFQKFQKSVCVTVSFFLNAKSLKSWIFDFRKYRFQEKYFIWVFWNSWKLTRERPVMKPFD